MAEVSEARVIHHVPYLNLALERGIDKSLSDHATSRFRPRDFTFLTSERRRSADQVVRHHFALPFNVHHPPLLKAVANRIQDLEHFLRHL